MKEEPLVRKSELLFLLAVTIALVAYVYPTRYELAIFQLAGYQNDPAIEQMKRQIIERPKNVTAIRLLMEALEAKGRYEESAELAKRLTELRPRNAGFRKKYINYLNRTGNQKQATQETERFIFEGYLPATREAFQKLERDYEWLQMYADAIRVREHMCKNDMGDEKDVVFLLRMYLSQGLLQKARDFALNVHTQGLLSKEFIRELFYVYLNNDDYNTASYFYHLLFNVPHSEISLDYRKPSFQRYLPEKLTDEHYEYLKEAVWFYHDRKMPEVVTAIVSRLISGGKADYDLYMLQANTFIRQKDFRQAAATLTKLRRNFRLDKKQLRELVDLYLAIKMPREAEKILLQLVRGTSIMWFSRFNLAATSNKIALQAIYLTAISGSAEIVSDARKLVDVYDAQKKPDKAIGVLQSLVDRAKRGELALSEKTQVGLQEEIADRYSWQGKTKKVRAILAGMDFSKLSPKSKALLILATEEHISNRQAVMVMKKLRRGDFKKMPAQLADGVRDVFRRYKEARRYESAGADDGKWMQEYLASKDFVFMGLPERDGIFYQRRYLQFNSEFLRTDLVSNPRVGLDFSMPLSANSQWAVVSNAGYTLHTKESVNLGSLMVGMRKRFKSEDELDLRAGSLFGGEFHKPQFRAQYLGSSSLFEYFGLTFNWAEPLAYTPEMINRGLTETVLQAYLESKLTAWARVNTNIRYRLSNIAENLNFGRGITINGRSYLGPKRWQFRLGPWFEFVDWKSDTKELENLLLSRTSAVGGLLRWATWGKNNQSYRVSFDLGFGYDLSRLDDDAQLGFLELEAQKTLGKKWAVSMFYSYYAAGLTPQGDSVTHNIKLGIVRAL